MNRSYFDLQLFAEDATQDKPAGQVPPVIGQAAQGQQDQSAGKGTQQDSKQQVAPKYTDEDVQNIVRGRLSAEQDKYKGFDTYSKAFTKLKELTGLDDSALLQQLEAAEVAQQAQRKGMPTQHYQPILDAQKQAQTALDKTNELHAELELRDMQADPVYADIKDEKVAASVREYAKKTGIPLRQAYWATRGTEVTKRIQADTEQRVLASIQQRLAAGGVITDSSTEIKETGLTKDELGAANVFGMSHTQYRAMRDITNLDEYNAYKERMKKQQKGG